MRSERHPKNCHSVIEISARWRSVSRAYAWLAESVIVSSEAYDQDSELADFADLLASYAPTGGEGLRSDEALLAEARRICVVLEDTGSFLAQ